MAQGRQRPTHLSEVNEGITEKVMFELSLQDHGQGLPGR